VPIMLQFALLLFGAALVVYTWNIDLSAAEVSLGVICLGFAFYTCIAIIATIWKDCPFQSPLSVLLRKLWLEAKEYTALAHVRWRRWWRHWRSRRLAALQEKVDQAQQYKWLTKLLRILAWLATPDPKQDNAVDVANNDPYMKLSNPDLWRQDPLYTSPVPKDISASAGFWLLENSTDFSAGTAVAAVFSEFQWPSHYRSTTVLIRLRDTYMECFRTPELKDSNRIKALQSAAAYYILYRTQLIWNTFINLEETKNPLRDLPPDLFLYEHSEEWNGDDVFEYILHKTNKMERTSAERAPAARFLSYIAPYWFCGDSDSAIKFRPSRLHTLNELIDLLQSSDVLLSDTITDCVLCVGAAMDFPLHPDDLIRKDKRCVRSALTHVHGINWG
jgi:hypothetical protein